VGADARAEHRQVVLLLRAIVRDHDLARLALHDELAERVAVERRDQQVADADVELDGLHVGLARRGGARAVVLHEERADEAPPEICEGQALRLELGVDVPDADDEVDLGLVRVAPPSRRIAMASPRPSGPVVMASIPAPRYAAPRPASGRASARGRRAPDFAWTRQELLGSEAQHAAFGVAGERQVEVVEFA
jgi:hypothetical protein